MSKDAIIQAEKASAGVDGKDVPSEGDVEGDTVVRINRGGEWEKIEVEKGGSVILYGEDGSPKIIIETSE